MKQKKETEPCLLKTNISLRSVFAGLRRFTIRCSNFDRVVTSLVIHHLTSNDKRRAFKEIYRVLKPHGELHVLDFGAPHSFIPRLMTAYMRPLEETADNFDGLIPRFIMEAGFSEVIEAQHFVTLFGPVSILRAVKGA